MWMWNLATNKGQTFVPGTAITFVSQASIESGTIATYKLKKRVEAVKNCRIVGKKDMKHNDVMPKMRVDPETYVSWPKHPESRSRFTNRSQPGYRLLKPTAWSVRPIRRLSYH